MRAIAPRRARKGGERMRRRRGSLRPRAGGAGACLGRSLGQGSLACRDGRGYIDHAEDSHHRRERRRQVQVGRDPCRRRPPLRPTPVRPRLWQPLSGWAKPGLKLGRGTSALLPPAPDRVVGLGRCPEATPFGGVWGSPFLVARVAESSLLLLLLLINNLYSAVAVHEGVGLK